MKKEAGWIPSKCATSVLTELARKPLTPVVLRKKTGMTKNNYVNIILKNLMGRKIIKCLNPKERKGRVFCINPVNSAEVEKLFCRKGISQKISELPDINWPAYGMLLCPYYTRLRDVLRKADELRKEGREITVFNLKEKLPAMATGDVYRALARLIKSGVIICSHIKKPKRFLIIKSGLAVMNFLPPYLI